MGQDPKSFPKAKPVNANGLLFSAVGQLGKNQIILPGGNTSHMDKQYQKDQDTFNPDKGISIWSILSGKHKFPGFKHGGIVPRTQPYMVHKNELVITAKDAAKVAKLMKKNGLKVGKSNKNK